MYELNQSGDSDVIARYKNVTLKIHDKQEKAQYEDHEETILISQLETIISITPEAKLPETKNLTLKFVDPESGDIQNDVLVSSTYNSR